MFDFFSWSMSEEENKFPKMYFDNDPFDKYSEKRLVKCQNCDYTVSFISTDKDVKHLNEIQSLIENLLQNQLSPNKCPDHPNPFNS